MKHKEPWIVFYAPDGRELAAYTLRGSFAGELQATLELLADENSMSVGEISLAEITR